MNAALNTLRESLPEFAKDTKMNLSSVLTPEGSPGLTEKQIAGIALASAYAARVPSVVKHVMDYASGVLLENEIQGAKSAVSIMSMTNMYYRFLHLAEDPDIKTMPAKLRMSVVAQPGIDKAAFEMNALAVSVINGCSMCIQAHVAQLVKAGVTKEGVQSVARIASVIYAFSQSVFISEN